MNSYRGNGGGELLTKGAGIPQEELKKRISSSTDKDFSKRDFELLFGENKK